MFLNVFIRIIDVDILACLLHAFHNKHVHFLFVNLQVFPPVSKLDPSMYGPQESDLKEEHIINHLNGMSVQQVILVKE